MCKISFVALFFFISCTGSSNQETSKKPTEDSLNNFSISKIKDSSITKKKITPNNFNKQKIDTLYFLPEMTSDINSMQPNILLYRVNNDSVYLQVNKKNNFNFHATDINLIYTQKDIAIPIVIFNLKDTNNFYVAISINDSLFNNQSLLYIYRYLNGKFDEVQFNLITSKGIDINDYMIVKNYYALIDTQKMDIYAGTLYFSGGRNGTEGPTYQIDQYSLDTIANKLIFKKTKDIQSTSILKEPHNLIELMK